MSETCLFCKIIARQIPAQVVYEDQHVLAFRDIRPVAPTHVLIIPKVHFEGLDRARPEHVESLGHVLLAAGHLARELGIEASGYRTVINTGAAAGQTVFHLHLHLLGGRELTWPPG